MSYDYGLQVYRLGAVTDWVSVMVTVCVNNAHKFVCHQATVCVLQYLNIMWLRCMAKRIIIHLWRENEVTIYVKGVK